MRKDVGEIMLEIHGTLFETRFDRKLLFFDSFFKFKVVAMKPL